MSQGVDWIMRTLVSSVPALAERNVLVSGTLSTGLGPHSHPLVSVLSAHIVLCSPEQHADLKVLASQPDQTGNEGSELLPAGCRVLTQVLELSAVSPEAPEPSSPQACCSM